MIMIKYTNNKLGVGSILVAKPFWKEEIYKKSVILIIDHDKEETVGLMLNKETQLYVREALPEIKSNLALYYGGPMKTDVISYIHKCKDIDGAELVGDGIYYGGSTSDLKSRYSYYDKAGIRFIAGSVIWSASMLRQEMNLDKWWVFNAEAKDVFDTKWEELWAEKLTSNKHVYGLLNELADPSLN